MSVVSSAAADGFIQRLPKEIRFYLVHGPDEGLAHERVKAIIRNLIERRRGPAAAYAPRGRRGRARSRRARRRGLCGLDVRRRSGDLDRRASARPPAGARALVRPAAERLRDCRQGGTTQEGNGFKGRLRNLAIRASIECYSDDANALEALIDAEARAAGLAIAPDARAALVALTGADRQTTRGEIAKLMLYARGKPAITAEDVEAIVSDAAPSNLDEVVDQALLGDLPAVETALTRFFHDGGEADHLMMRLVARLLLLHRLRLEMDQGRPFDAACQALFVKLPMPARRALARQAERWTSESIAQRLPAVRLASARVRAESRLAEVLATRALWTLASRGRGGR